jgi:hypothetical protein
MEMYLLGLLTYLSVRLAVSAYVAVYPNSFRTNQCILIKLSLLIQTSIYLTCRKF